MAKVIDWRIRQQTTGMPAVAARPWGAGAADRGRRTWTGTRASWPQAMDDRQRRLGEHAAEHQPAVGPAARPGARAPAGPGRVGAQGRAGGRLPGDVGLRPPVRPDRPPARPAFPGGPCLLAGRRRSARLPPRRPPRAQRRPAVGLAVRVRPGDGLGAPVQGRRPGCRPRRDPPHPDRGRPRPPQRRSRRHRRRPATPGRPGRRLAQWEADDPRPGRPAHRSAGRL